MTEPFRGPYQLDPWQSIVAVHFPKGDQPTKLDFVGNRYMVRGQDQELAEVIGSPHHDAEAQLACEVPGVGLDLRQYNSFGVQASGKTVYFRNKTDKPDKTNPGALNELLRHDYSLVVEWAWFDVLEELNRQSPGGFTHWDAVYPLLQTQGNVDDTFFVISNAEKVMPPEEGVYQTAAWDYHMLRDNGDGTGLFVCNLVDMPVGAEGFTPPPPSWGSGDGSTFIAPLGAPNDEVFIVPGTSATFYPYSVDASVCAYELPVGSSSDDQIGGRLVGAWPDYLNDTGVPMANGQLPAPQGTAFDLTINRMAVTVDGDRLVAAVNGTGLVELEQPATFSRPYPTDPDTGITSTYYPIEPMDGAPWMNTYEALTSLPGIIRCIWIYRKKKSNEQLLELSKVKPLTPPTDPKWKTT